MRALAILLAFGALPGCGSTLTEVDVDLPPTVSTASQHETLSVLPHYEDGERRGVFVRRARPGSVAANLRLSRGDVILAFDGVPCDDVRRCRTGARRVEAALRRRRPFSLLVRRGDQSVHYRYQHVNVHRFRMK